MYIYASLASVGDDVYHEPSTIALEAHMAKLTGKEAALFVPSGTMSNQLALRTHLKQPPYSVVCDQRAHINKFVSRQTHTRVVLLTKSYQATRLAAQRFTLVLTPYPSFLPTVSTYSLPEVDDYDLVCRAPYHAGRDRAERSP